MEQRKLNIGCGKDIREGWVNVDIRELPGVDVVCDIRNWTPFVDGRFEEVLMQDVLEHFSIKESKTVLEEVYRIAKQGCTLTIEVPNILMQAQQWLNNEITTERFSVIVYGHQDYPENAHKQLFDEGRLAECVVAAGFKVQSFYTRGRALGCTAIKG